MADERPFRFEWDEDLVIDVKQNAYDEKKGELEKNHNPAREQRQPALMLVACREEPLDKELLGSVAGSSQKASAQQARPEAIGSTKESCRERNAEIEHLELVRGLAECDGMRPTSRGLMQDEKEADERTTGVQDHLQDVGPNDGGHTAFESVEECEGNDGGDGGKFPRSEHDGDDNRYGKNANAFSQGSQHEEGGSGELPDFLAEASLHQLVGCVHFTAEVVWKEKNGDNDAPQQVAEDQLQEAEVAYKGERGSADNGQGTGLCGHDREGDSPPGRSTASQEIVFERFLGLPELRSEPSDEKQIGSDHRQIREAHGKLDDSMR